MQQSLKYTSAGAAIFTAAVITAMYLWFQTSIPQPLEKHIVNGGALQNVATAKQAGHAATTSILSSALRCPLCSAVKCRAAHNVMPVGATMRDSEPNPIPESVQPDTAASRAAATAWTTGNKKVLFIIVRFSDQPNEPQSFADATTMMSTVGNWFATASYGLLSMTTTVTPCYVLPNNEAYYDTSTNANGDYALQSDARTLAATGGYDYTQFDLDAIRSATNGQSADVGMAFIGARGCWLKTSDVSRAEHEFGHNLGLHHSNFWNASNNTIVGPGAYEEYGDHYNVMGDSSNASGQYGAYEKNLLGWIPDANVNTISANGTYRLYSFDSSIDATNAYALKVNKDSLRNYWIQFRQTFTANKYLMNGVELHWNPYSGSAGSLLLDTNPSSADGRDASAVALGYTFSDNDADIHITPIRKGGTTPESIDVVVNIGTMATNHAPTLLVAASATSVPANGAITLTANASDPDGDTLAYFWDLGDGSFGTNNAVIIKSWTNPGTYVVACTASDMKGGTANQTLTITVTAPAPGSHSAQKPVFISQAQVSQPSMPGQPVTLTAAASSPSGATLIYNWNFGDGTTGVGAAAAHVYAAAGLYNADVTVSDGINSVTQTLNVTISNDAPAISTNAQLQNGFNVSKAAIKFNFKGAGKDSVSMAGTVSLENAFNPSGKTIVLAVGDVKHTFTLDAKGKAQDATASFKLSGKMNKNAFSGSSAKFTLTLQNQSLLSDLETLGFTNQDILKPGKQIELPVLISIGNVNLAQSVAVNYVAKLGTNGLAMK